jgi:hypothetical protein
VLMRSVGQRDLVNTFCEGACQGCYDLPSRYLEEVW